MTQKHEDSTVILLYSLSSDASSAAREIYGYIARSKTRKVVLILHKELEVDIYELMRELVLINHVYTVSMYSYSSRREALEAAFSSFSGNSIIILATGSDAGKLARELEGKAVVEVA
ncbi:MAG: hypothetical protein OWQ48_00800 [Desulfurococcus sp.]|nr:hypothetical protein [Desulfurococcus sp.]